MATIELTAEVVEWRGPAPHHFLVVPPESSEAIRALAPSVTYGWGMVPVTARIGEVEWTTSLWPKDGGYVLPLKVATRRAAALELGDVVTATLVLDAPDAVGDRDGLIRLVRRIQDGEATSEEQEEAWLAEFASQVPHPRAIDLVLFGEVELGEDASAERVVEVALGYREDRR